MKYYILLAFCILANSFGLILTKKGALYGETFASTGSNINYWLHLFLNRYVIIGVLLCGVSAIFWILVLTRIHLSLAYSLVSSTYILIAIASYFLLNEPLPLSRWMGIFIIITGIIVMFQE